MSEELAQKRSSASGEDGHASEILRCFEMSSSLDFLCRSGSSSLCRGSTTTTKLFLGFNHCLNTVVHVLDKINFGSSESSLVGDVVDVVCRLGVFSMDSSDLNVELVSDLLEVGHFDSELGQLNVDGGSEGGTEVGGARSDVTEMLVVGKFSDLLDLGSCLGESSEDGSDVSAWLH